MSSQNDDFRSRTWWTVVYSEHFPDKSSEEIQEIIRSGASASRCGLGFVSPEHSPDQDDSQDSVRKPHFHLMIKFSSKKSVEQFYDTVSSFLPENSFAIDMRHSVDNNSRVRDWNSCARYLVHKDNPEKQQFENGVASIASFGGADVVKDTINSSEVSVLVDEMKLYVYENDISQWKYFDLYCIHERPDWSRLLNTNQFVQSAIWKAVKSCGYSKR